MPYKNIKAYEMQYCIDNCKLSCQTKSNIKNLWVHLDKFAMELDIISKCYSTLLTTPPLTRNNKKSIYRTRNCSNMAKQRHQKYGYRIIFFIYSISLFRNVKFKSIRCGFM